jgi:flagellar basal-body rod protein FlgF
MSGRMLEGESGSVPVEHLDLAQGAFRQTDRTLDVALDGPGFLVVRTATGERLTRGGSLHLDSGGQLTDADGNPILGDKGPILPGIGAVEIQADGTVLVDGAPLDHLRLETVADPATLRKEGTGRFLIPDGAKTVPAGAVTVRQGSVEEPNGDAELGMIDLVTIQRAYAANVDALKAMDGVLARVANEVGRVEKAISATRSSSMNSGLRTSARISRPPPE